MPRRLTAIEKAWIASLSSLMRRMPSTLLLLECADCLMVVDKEASRSVDLEDGKARTAGVVLADIATAATKITSVSG